MKFLMRVLGVLFLAVAVVFAVGDIARSIADEATRLVSVNQALASFGLPVLGAGASPPSTAADIAAAIGQWSVTITTGLIGLALLVLGRKPQRREQVARR